MALTIEQADIGYDQAGLSQLISDINTKVIDDAKAKLEAAKQSLRTSLEPVWQGQSAKNFIENMDKDIDAIKGAMDSARDALETQLSQITNQMTQIDQQLVKKN